MRQLRWLIPMMVLMALAAVACGGVSTNTTSQSLAKQRATQEKAQVDNQNRAMSDIPIPVPETFMTRQQVARWSAEMDKPQVWYMYAFMEGFAEPIALFVADAPATPYCAFLTKPEQTIQYDGGDYGAISPINVQSPGIDGVYWGSGDCFSYQYFWDEVSGAMIQIQDFKMMMATARLSFLDVPEIKVRLTVDENATSTPLTLP